jgi:hypothetical protein
MPAKEIHPIDPKRPRLDEIGTRAARRENKGAVMAQENEPIKNLTAARDREVAHRREVAGALAEKYDRAHTEITFISIQSTIDAIDRAIADENRIASRQLEPAVKVA